MKKYFNAISAFLLPSFLLRLLRPIHAIKLKKGARIGFSILLVNRLELNEGAKIGHFNLININKGKLDKKAQIGKLNKIDASTLDLILHQHGAIGDYNWIYRANSPVTYDKAILEIGIYSKVTVKHHLDCTRSIKIGNYSILAGIGSQIWTHGYFHADQGIDRVRIDGPVTIGNNVNISSACVINSGVTIHDGITVGSNVCISKSISQKGMYVSQSLRIISNSIENIRANYSKIEGHDLIEEVYQR